MPDIDTVWDVANGRGDYVVAAPDLQTGHDLETAVLISLFTDRMADPDDVVPDGTNDPRGWWGDLAAAYRIGSKIWLRMRSKLNDQVVALVKDDITTALQWLIDDGVAAKIDVATEKDSGGRINMLGAQITIHKPAGPPVLFNYSWVWGAES